MKTENRITVVCYNVIKGGGASLVLNFINFLIDKNIPATVICPDNDIYRSFAKQLAPDLSVKLRFFPLSLNKVYFKPIINYVYLPLYTLFLRGRKIYNLGNVAFPSFKPQFLLLHNAFPLSDDPVILERMPKNERNAIQMMSSFILANLRWADVVGVQTNTIKNRLLAKKNIEAQLIPNVISFRSEDVKPLQIPLDAPIKLLVLSKYHSHKNLEVLIPLAKLIKEGNLNFEITVTFDLEISTEKGYLENLEAENLHGVIKNIGGVPFDRLGEVYANHHGLLLPTLLESFSGTYCESMQYERPIFTSDRDFAREVCQDAAYYFDPMNEKDILKTLTTAYADVNGIAQKVTRGKEIVQAYLKFDSPAELIYESI